MRAVAEDRKVRFRALVDEVYEPLQRYARRRCAPDDADDLVADALLVLWRRLDDVPSASPLPWAYRVAGNCLANRRRGERRRSALVSKLVAVGPLAVLEEPDLPDRELHDAMAALDPSDRELLALWAWEDLSPSELAVVLGITSNAVSIRLHRAKARLAEMLVERRKEPLVGGQETNDDREQIARERVVSEHLPSISTDCTQRDLMGSGRWRVKASAAS